MRRSGEFRQGLEEYAALLGSGELSDEELVHVGSLALRDGKLELAGRCLDRARQRGVVDGVTAFRRELEAELLADPEPGEPVVTFAHVAGLDEAKKAIRRTIVLPFRRPDLCERYGRRTGDGVMLYGPPGCGKTLLAQAAAGECGLPFFGLGIEDVLTPGLSRGEDTVHAALANVREQAPCVLFIDELDGFAYTRRRQRGGSCDVLAGPLLGELDAINADPRGVFVLSATDAPWDVDDRLNRPGRLGRLAFVPPPDHQARMRILELQLSGRPTSNLDLGRLAADTPLFSGADLRTLVEIAAEEAVEEGLASDSASPPLTMVHLERARARMRTTTIDWLATARNYVEFANSAGRYDDVLAFLRTSEAKSARA